METEVLDVWKSYRLSRDPRLRNFLIESHMGIVEQVAGRLHRSLPRTVEQEDLVSAGSFGLIAALDQFDPEHGRSLASYCAMRIRGAILDDLRRQDWVPRRVRKESQRLERAAGDLEAELGRAPQEDELAAAMALTVEELQAALARSSQRAMVSMVSNFGSGEDDDAVGLESVALDESSPEPGESLDRRELLQRLRSSLTRKERLILMLHYDEGRSMREIGEMLSLTRSRVCQIHSNLRSRLQARFAAD